MKLIKYSVENKGKLAYCEFSGTMLYSDTVSLDSAYKTLTDSTYYEFNEKQKELHEEYKRQEEEHKNAIPELTKEWTEKGHKILSKNKWDYWDKIVPIRLGDLYHGMELGCCLDIVKALNDGCSLDETKHIIEGQNHSGMSYGLVRAMVSEFCDRGNEFSEYVK